MIKRFILAQVIALILLSCGRNYSDKYLLTERQNIVKGYAICKISELKLEGLKINHNFNCLSSQGDSIAFKQIIKEGKFVILFDSRKCDMCFDAICDQIRENYSL